MFLLKLVGFEHPNAEPCVNEQNKDKTNVQTAQHDVNLDFHKQGPEMQYYSYTNEHEI